MGFRTLFLQLEDFLNKTGEIIAQNPLAVPARPQGRPHFQMAPINRPTNAGNLQSFTAGSLNNDDVFWSNRKIHLEGLPWIIIRSLGLESLTPQMQN